MPPWWLSFASPVLDVLLVIGGLLAYGRAQENAQGPRQSTAVCLNRPDALLRHLGVQDRPHVSTTVVSTALAAGPLYPAI